MSSDHDKKNSPAEILNIGGRLEIMDEPAPFLVPDEMDLPECNPVAPPEPPPGMECDDASHVGQQDISWAQWVANNHTDGNPRSSWGHMGTDGEVYAMTGRATCGGGNMSYSNATDCCEINHYTDDGATLVKTVSPNLPAVPPASAAVICTPGQSDEPLFHIGQDGAVSTAMVYPVLGIRIQPAAIAGDTYIGPGAWLKNGDALYWAGTRAGNIGKIRQYSALDQSRPTPVVQSSQDITGVSSIRALSCTADHIYAYVWGSAGEQRIVKLNRSDLTIHTDPLVTISGLGINGIHSRADDTIWLIGEQGGRWAIYYWNGSELIFVGHGARPTAMVFSGQAMHFRGRSMYFGMRGFGATSTAIYKSVIPCDEGAGIFASITTEPSVAAGGTISVTWANVLLPIATDRIAIRPAPADDTDSGMGSTQIANALTGGGGSGTISVIVPGDATPGNYIAQFLSQNTVYVCRSAAFTVT